MHEAQTKSQKSTKAGSVPAHSSTAPALSPAKAQAVPAYAAWAEVAPVPPLLSDAAQCKLNVSQPEDPLEREADAVAQRVADGGKTPAVSTAGPLARARAAVSEEEEEPEREEAPVPLKVEEEDERVQRSCAACDEEPGELLHRTADGPAPTPGHGARAVPNTEAVTVPPRGGGRPLSDSARGYFEPRFGRDFGGVRVHTGRAAAESARSLNAQAYTVGREIVFSEGRYSPETRAGRLLLAHELTHVAQQGGGRTAGAGPSVQRQPVAPIASTTEQAEFENVLHETNLVLHWRALERLQTRPEPWAFDLILRFMGTAGDLYNALDSALVFFLFHPETALARTLRALRGDEPAQAEHAVTFLLHAVSMRGNASGPAPAAAYRMLDDWVLASDLQHEGLVTRALKRRQTTQIITRMRDLVARAWWQEFDPHPGATFFARAMDELLPRIPTMRDEALETLNLQVLSAEPVVTQTASRIDELRSRILRLAIDAHLPPESDELVFLREQIIGGYDTTLRQGSDFLALLVYFPRAEAAYNNQASLYQGFKVARFQQHWREIERGEQGIAYPLTNHSGLRGKTNELYGRFFDHRNALEPRLQSLVSRQEAREQLSTTEMFEVQRDLYLVALELMAVADVSKLFLAYEQLERIEPDVFGDFNEIQAQIVGYANRIHAAVVGDNFPELAVIRGEVDFRVLPDLIDIQVRYKDRQARVINIGILALSMIGGGLLGLALRGGSMLVFGSRLVQMGATGARVLSAVEFTGNVVGFTLAQEGLSSAAFGRGIRWGEMPLHLLENAATFALFGGISRITSRIMANARGPLMEAIGFSVRHGVGMTSFAAVGALQARIFQGQWPPDWRDFLGQTVATYAVLGVIGSGLGGLRQRMDRRLLTPHLEARFEALAQREAAVLSRLRQLTGAEPGMAEAERVVRDAEALAAREEVNGLSREYSDFIRFLRGVGAITPADATTLIAAANTAAEGLNAVRLTTPVVTALDLARLEGVVSLGDGFTFQYNARGEPRGLSRALQFYMGRQGYSVERNPTTGEINVTTAGGELVARFIPNLTSSLLSASLTGRGVDPAVARQLVQLPAEFHPRLRAMHPAVLDALASIAQNSPQRAARLLSASSALRFLEAQPEQAVSYLRLLAAFDRLRFSETHLHTVGAIPYPELLIRSMMEARTVAQLNENFAAVEGFANQVIDTFPEGPLRQAAQRNFARLRPDLQVLRNRIEAEIEAQYSDVEVAAMARRMTDRLAEVVTIPLQAASAGPQIDLFFRIYAEMQAGYWERASGEPRAGVPGRRVETMGDVAESLRGANVVYVELRQGLGEPIETAILAALNERGALTRDGRPTPDVRVIITIPRGAAGGNPQQLLQTLARVRANPRLARVVVGIDLSGPEQAGRPTAGFAAVARQVVLNNFGDFETALQSAPPEVAARVTELLGIDPVQEGRRLRAAINATGAAAAAESPLVSELAALNRRVQEALVRVGQERGQSLLPPTLLGVTIHAGEQISSASVRLDALLAIVRQSIRMGADRIGHGLVLGIRLPADLAQLGFRRVSTLPGGVVWVRTFRGPNGQPVVEGYTEEQLGRMEADRRELINLAATLGLTVELNPTSNIVLGGLPPGTHPLRGMLEVRPDLRVSVSSDNPAIHRIDVASELALLVSSVRASYVTGVSIYLEGYASRLGGRPMEAAAALRGQILDGLVTGTPPGQRAEVILQLFRRYGVGAEPRSSSMSRIEYERALDVYLRRVIY